MSKYLVLSAGCVNFTSKFLLNGRWPPLKASKNICLMCLISKTNMLNPHVFGLFLAKADKFYKKSVSGNILGANVLKWKFWFRFFLWSVRNGARFMLVEITRYWYNRQNVSINSCVISDIELQVLFWCVSHVLLVSKPKMCMKLKACAIIVTIFFSIKFPI